VTIDPLNDPAPALSWKTVLTMGGWVAAAAFAVAGLTYADQTNATADRHRAELQAVTDREQNERLNKIEARQGAQGDLLFDICMAVDCREKRKTNAR
jgi:hypothetical protein